MNLYYKQRIENFRNLQTKYEKRNNIFAFLRLTVIVLGIILFYSIFQRSVAISVVTAISFVILFAITVKLDLRNLSLIDYNKNLADINEKELQCIEGKYDSFAHGEEYKVKDHPFSSDLDIFGIASLFQYINRTVSQYGSDLLAKWLTEPADEQTITERQNAAKELKDKIDWRQNLLHLNKKFKSNENNVNVLIDWLNNEPDFSNNYVLIWVCRILPIVSFIVLFFTLLNLPSGWYFLLITIHFFLAFRINQKVSKIEENAFKNAKTLKLYHNLIKTIENETFSSAKLTEMKRCFYSEKMNASKRISKLSILLSNLEIRTNIFAHFFLNTFFFWDFHNVLWLEQWKAKNKTQIAHWFEVLGEFEALSSFANLHFNNPDWTFAETKQSNQFSLIANEIGHPLINKKNRVLNDFSIKSNENLILITGSNMAGKSTFLRTLGVNMLLAAAGAPVCASRFSISLFNILTCMRIADSITENASTFYAELKRIGAVVTSIRNSEKNIYLLDEILKGTNSVDRHKGAEALLKQVIKNNAMCILATHDLELCSIESDFPDKVKVYNFDVQVNNEELFFDYKIHSGICKSKNATLLMKKIGIEI